VQVRGFGGFDNSSSGRIRFAEADVCGDWVSWKRCGFCGTQAMDEVGGGPWTVEDDVLVLIALL
jgi:hypothetical protein